MEKKEMYVAPEVEILEPGIPTAVTAAGNDK